VTLNGILIGFIIHKFAEQSISGGITALTMVELQSFNSEWGRLAVIAAGGIRGNQA